MNRFVVMVGACLGFAAGAAGQVNLPEGFEIVEFGDFGTSTLLPHMNDCGQIVFSKDRFEDSRIWLYDNGHLMRLTDENGGRFSFAADINNAGTVVWMEGFFNQHESFELIMLRDGKRTIVGPGSTPSINAHDVVAASLFRGISCQIEEDIVVYTGRRAIRVSNNRYREQSPQINDLRDVTWDRGDFCENPWVADIRLWSDRRTITLPSGSSTTLGSSINNARQVVSEAGPPVNGIEQWEDGRTTLLIDRGRSPRLNDRGDIFFLKFHPENNQSWDTYLYVADGGNPRIHRLSDDDLWNVDGDINNWGEVVWRWFRDPPRGDFTGGLRYLRRIRTGDFEYDGDVDLADYAALADCLTGPDWDERVQRGPGQSLCDCRFLDLDDDGDVDLADIARFQNAFGK